MDYEFEAKVAQSIVSQNARIEAQGRLKLARGALFTAINTDGETQELPGLVLDFLGPELGDQRMSLVIPEAQEWFDMLLNHLGLVMDEESMQRIMNVIREETIKQAERGGKGMVRNMPRTDNFEEDPNDK